MSLKRYRSKRNFRSSSEPTGNSGRRAGAGKGRQFVIQRHAASSLHFDFRLEVDGVLRSWAVPKGPSLNPRHKRMAIPTEDHPMDYVEFEGVIPQNEYGGGTVMVWDRGTYTNLTRDDSNRVVGMARALHNGRAEVSLDGEVLSGGFALVRMDRGPMEGNWLLIKMDDEFADARRNPASTHTHSVMSGRTMKQIEAAAASKAD